LKKRLRFIVLNCLSSRSKNCDVIWQLGENRTTNCQITSHQCSKLQFIDQSQTTHHNSVKQV